MASCLFPLIVWMVHILSLHVNGLRRHKINNLLSTCHCEILCLQETKWDEDVLNYVIQQWEGTVFASYGSAKSCGVAVLVKKGIMDKCKCTFKDDIGRIIVVDLIQGKQKN